jgi:hypothetical protein
VRCVVCHDAAAARDLEFVQLDEDGRTEHELETVAIGEDPPVRSTLHRGALVSGT